MPAVISRRYVRFYDYGTKSACVKEAHPALGWESNYRGWHVSDVFSWLIFLSLSRGWVLLGNIYLKGDGVMANHASRNPSGHLL